MLQMLTWKRVAAGAVFVSIAAAAVIAQQKGPARGNHDWAPTVPQGKHHTLAATLETVQWGWLDPREKPKLTINSGDTVSIETMMHSHDKVQPGTTMEQVVELRKANPGGGPHSMTGPIYVNGAEPGDVLEIRILRIEPKAWAINFNLPGKDFPTIGALASEMPEGHIKFFPHRPGEAHGRVQAGHRASTCSPSPGRSRSASIRTIPLPARAASRTIRWRRCRRCVRGRTGRTWTSTSCRRARRSSSRCSSRAGCIWTGDSHCRQGNGEVNLTALECSYKEIRIQPIVRKDMKLNWPFIETRTHWITTGFNEDLNVAMVNAMREAVDWLANQKMVPMNRYEAYGLVSMVGDCRVSQVVDIRKGVHCMIPKSIFTNVNLRCVIRSADVALALATLALGGASGRPSPRRSSGS